MILRRGDNGPAVARWQRELLAAEARPVLTVDGDFGGETEKATKDFQRRAGLLDDGEVGDMTRAAMASEVIARRTAAGQKELLTQAIVSIASSQIGVKEESRNRGAGIAKYWEATSYPDGMKNREPWCAAFVCWVIREAFKAMGCPERRRPTSASVVGILNWARTAKGVRVVPAQGGAVAKPGDIVIYEFSSRPDHTGFALAFTHGVKHPLFAVEGNTDANGSREGTEVAARSRSLGGVLAYIRFEEVAG